MMLIFHRNSPTRALALALLLFALALAGCGQAASNPPKSPTPTKQPVLSVPRLQHIFLIVLENREYAPAKDPAYIAGLKSQGAFFTHYYGITHPSLPNYLALLAGHTFGINQDLTSDKLYSSTLVGQLEAAHKTWAAYMEDMPSPCFTGVSYKNYVIRHNPFMYFPSIAGISGVCAKIRPFTQMQSDLSASVPNFVWITPNLCDNGHNCPDTTVAAFLSRTMGQIQALPAYKSGSVIFVTHDEGTSDAGCCVQAHGGHIETFAVGSGIQPNTTVSTPVDHYSLLRTIEDGLGLGHIGHASCTCTPTLADAWKK